MNIKLYALLLGFIFLSCNKPKSLEINNSKENNNKNILFSQSLKGEILKMKKLKDDKQKKGYSIRNICSVILGTFDGENECSVIITLMTNIDSSKITGYTFLENELITCYILSDSCKTSLINESGLIKDVDSIPGYPNTIKTSYDVIYDAPIAKYQIFKGDSLVLKSSSFIFTDN